MANPKTSKGLNKIAYSREFTPEGYAEMVDSLNTVLGTLLMSQNFDGQIIEDILLPSGQNVRVSHNLKTTPKYRIILRKQGSLTIEDGDLPWNDKYIYLKSDGAGGSATVSILLMRG